MRPVTPVLSTTISAAPGVWQVLNEDVWNEFLDKLVYVYVDKGKFKPIEKNV